MQVLLGLLLGYIMHDVIQKTPVGEFLDQVKPSPSSDLTKGGING